eukprot:SAG25_NODE_2418_length_1626_cov_1.876883_2_plen_171_part_00
MISPPKPPRPHHPSAPLPPHPLTGASCARALLPSVPRAHVSLAVRRRLTNCGLHTQVLFFLNHHHDGQQGGAGDFRQEHRSRQTYAPADHARIGASHGGQGRTTEPWPGACAGDPEASEQDGASTPSSADSGEEEGFRSTRRQGFQEEGGGEGALQDYSIQQGCAHEESP